MASTSSKSTPSDSPKPEPIVFREPEQFDLTNFPCPRCDAPTAAETYGPCPNCVAELRATQQSEATAHTAAAFEPKMNVTPNAVATKE